MSKQFWFSVPSFNSRLYFRGGIINAKGDSEKLLIPGIIYCSKSEDNVTVYWLGIGWWHWGVSVAFGIKKLKNKTR